MGRVFATADWHGCGKAAKEILEWLEPEDTLYFLGDAIDRGPDGIALLDTLLQRPNTYFLKGNHEEMMNLALNYLAKDNHLFVPTAQHWFQNGGDVTWEVLKNKNKEEILEYQTKIKNMYYNCIYQSPNGHWVILSHAGFTPFCNREPRDNNPLWNRSHFVDKWDEGGEYGELEPKDTYLVHGHTPVQYLRFEYGYRDKTNLSTKEMKHKNDWYKGRDLITPKIIRYCDAHKFDIDMCTIVSKRVALLDLDTFKEIYFEEEN